MYDNLLVYETVWCDILGFDQLEQMNIKLMLHSVRTFWQIAVIGIAKKNFDLSFGRWSKLAFEKSTPNLERTIDI